MYPPINSAPRITVKSRHYRVRQRSKYFANNREGPHSICKSDVVISRPRHPRISIFPMIVRSGHRGIRTRSRLGRCRGRSRLARAIASFYWMYNSNFVVWIMCNDAAGVGREGVGRSARVGEWKIELRDCRGENFSLCREGNAINNRGEVLSFSVTPQQPSLCWNIQGL